MTVTFKLHSSDGNPITVKKPNETQGLSASLSPKLRCPHCMHLGAFDVVIPNDLRVRHIERTEGKPPKLLGDSLVGLRVCPNADCLGVVMVVVSQKDGKTVALPSEVLDFDVTDVPAAIAASLEEAVKCHSAQCYKAAALMVRRVLEELCEERGATGVNLKARIEALAGLIVIPAELLKAADHLRLLGNDAAHIEAKTYASIGEAEVRVAIDLTKELLKAAYQYKGLLSRLEALQRARP